MRMKHTVAAWPQTNTLGELYSRLPRHLHKRIPNPSQAPFNDGLTLVDLARWRQEDRTAALLRKYDEYEGQADSQLLMNLEFPEGSFDILDWRWNLYTYH